MTTLDTAPLAALLYQLFIDADATSALFRQQLDALPATQRRAMMASKDDYVAFYSRAKDAHLAVSRETGTLLYMLARAINARTIIEFGIRCLYLTPCRRTPRQWRWQAHHK
jgi:hypothetical protein